MAKYDDSYLSTDQIVEFTYEGNSYQWVGDYEVRQWGERPSYDYLGDSEQEVIIIRTTELVKYNEDTDNWDDVYPSGSILATIENEIESTL